MKVKFAFVGFRHGHILSLLSRAGQRSDTQVVAACEEDAATRAELRANGTVEITHDDYESMLSSVPCDVVAIGDYYAKRGALAIRALEAGKHVIADKPLCTSLEELARIRELSKECKLAVGCQLDLRQNPALYTMRKHILAGEIGDVLTVNFSGQHPRMLGNRPDWYFQPGCHGGTINDIAIHAMDAIGWLTGRRIVEIVAARVWNGKTPEHTCFQDGAQLMLRLDNDGGVLGDVSYLAPDACGYAAPQYWRVTCHGTNGVIETRCGDEDVVVASDADKSPRRIALLQNPAPGYLDNLLSEIRHEAVPADCLTTERVLYAAHLALLTQYAADNGLPYLRCPDSPDPACCT